VTCVKTLNAFLFPTDHKNNSKPLRQEIRRCYRKFKGHGQYPTKDK